MLLWNRYLFFLLSLIVSIVCMLQISMHVPAGLSVALTPPALILLPRRSRTRAHACLDSRVTPARAAQVRLIGFIVYCR